MNKIYNGIIRSITNDGNLAKLYVFLVFDERYEPTIIMRKLFLSKEITPGIKIIKKYKDWHLHEDSFGVKYNTIANILYNCSEIIKKQENE